MCTVAFIERVKFLYSYLYIDQTNFNKLSLNVKYRFYEI